MSTKGSSCFPGAVQECTRDCGTLLVRGIDPASPDGQRLAKAAKALHKVQRSASFFPVTCLRCSGFRCGSSTSFVRLCQRAVNTP